MGLFAFCAGRGYSLSLRHVREGKLAYRAPLGKCTIAGRDTRIIAKP